MALWFFGRRKNRTRKRSEVVASSPSDQLPDTPSPTANAKTSIPNHENSPSATPKAHRRNSKRRKNGRDQTLAGNEDACLPPRQIITPSPGPPAERHTTPSFPSSAAHRSSPVEPLPSRSFTPSRFESGFNMSQSSLVRSINDVPTLRSKRSSEPSVIRRKSSKRKRNDLAREQEVKNMSLGSNLDIHFSKTRADSGDSRSTFDRMNSISPDSHAYKLSMFHALSPRPVLRYSEAPRYSPTPPTPKSSAGKGKSKAIQAGDGKNRINELADEMDASTLRELMDRDRRRRAARQSSGQRSKSEKSPKRQRQPLMETRDAPRHDIKMNINAAIVDRKPNQMAQPQTPDHSESWLRDPSKESFPARGNEQNTNMVKEKVQRAPSIGDDDKSFVNVSAADATANSKSDTTSQLAGQEMGPILDISPNQKRETRLSSNAGRIGRSLSTFFRRGSRFKREPRGQLKEGPSFSVPSRESFSRISYIEAAGTPPAIPKKSSIRFDGQSIQSRFTEHFDDLGSPDNMRSSTAINIYPSSNRFSVGTGRATLATAATTEAQDAFRGSGANSPDTRPNSMFLAQSLASIDSEGSWLSGKPSRHLSQSLLGQYRSGAESKEKLDDPAESPEEGTASGEFFAPLCGAPVPEEEEDIEIAEGIYTEVQIDEETTWHGSVGRRAHLVRPGTRAKSKEGLLSDFLESASDIHTPEGDSPLDIEGEMEIRRATSIDLGKSHVRRISAGSAKLLELPSRYSGDRRPSSGTISSGVLPSTPLIEHNEQAQS
ncbi:hypothetical protein PRK78_006386 [Emydomyces testavorans]|uniref:Uncharacterized protein n=1 Tax=Emydomyces testavorans TaxID=2070801 RepID=A0AAF0IKS9_9EURO|nr:hypothetical protein PRK78_006386 [Emydomyces testavorans]